MVQGWGERRLIAHVLYALAQVREHQGAMGQARELTMQSLDLYQRMGIEDYIQKAEELVSRLTPPG